MPGDAPSAGHNVGGVAAERLRSIVDRIERLHEERKALSSDISDIYKESKSAGFDDKVIKSLVRVRSKDAAEVEEHDALLALYMRALGM